MLRCGIDLIENQRIADGIARFGDRFLNRFFTPDERADCEDQPHRLAARLAAKEAVAKALGTGIWRNGVNWVDIEVLKDGETGAPQLHLHGAAAAVAGKTALHTWSVSLSHDRTRSIALVVAL